MKLTRRQFVVGTAAGAVGAAGIYELVDQFSGGSPQRAAGAVKLPEQHLLEGVRVVRDDGVEVLVPPLHHQILTARVAVDRSELADARVELERELAGLDDDYAPSPAGLGVTVAWGRPYFDRFVPAAARRLLPLDRRAGKPVLIDAERFPSDPEDTRLEQNHVAFLLRSDARDHIEDAAKRIRGTKLFDVTSVRRGFSQTSGGGSTVRFFSASTKGLVWSVALTVTDARLVGSAASIGGVARTAADRTMVTSDARKALRYISPLAVPGRDEGVAG